MTLEQIIQMVIQVIIFLIASYFIFYKSWLKSLGRETAKLSTAEELTRLVENVKKDFNEKIEIYKSKLSEELALKIEPLKSELAKNNITHQIQFSFLHQERGKVILELYKKLIELHSAMSQWTNVAQVIYNDAEREEEERALRANTAIHDFKNFYLLNKIFFNRTFCSDIDAIFKDYWDKGWEFGLNKKRIKSGNLTMRNGKDELDIWTEISKEINDKFPSKIEEIEIQFRKILNVEEE
jgi:hypothetical protein